jgi:hypothetical protein
MRWRWSLVRLFQRVYAEASMGNFISYTNRCWEAVPITVDWCQKAIDAYIHYITLPRILSMSGEDIVHEPTLDEWFSRWPAYVDYKRRYWSGELKHVERVGDRDFIHKLAHLLKVDVIVDHLEEAMKYVGFGAELLAGWALAWAEDLALGKHEVNEWITQQLERGSFYTLDYLAHKSGVLKWDPWYHFDWAVITSEIYLLQQYRRMVQEEEHIAIPAFIAGQRVWVGKTPRDAIAVSRVDEKGEAWIFIPRRYLTSGEGVGGPGGPEGGE